MIVKSPFSHIFGGLVHKIITSNSRHSCHNLTILTASSQLAHRACKSQTLQQKTLVKQFWTYAQPVPLSLTFFSRCRASWSIIIEVPSILGTRACHNLPGTQKVAFYIAGPALICDSNSIRNERKCIVATSFFCHESIWPRPFRTKRAGVTPVDSSANGCHLGWFQLNFAVAWSSEPFDLFHCLEFQAIWFIPLLGVPSYLIYAIAWS